MYDLDETNERPEWVSKLVKNGRKIRDISMIKRGWTSGRKVFSLNVGNKVIRVISFI